MGLHHTRGTKVGGFAALPAGADARPTNLTAAQKLNGILKRSMPLRFLTPRDSCIGSSRSCGVLC